MLLMTNINIKADFNISSVQLEKKKQDEIVPSRRPLKARKISSMLREASNKIYFQEMENMQRSTS